MNRKIDTTVNNLDRVKELIAQICPDPEAKTETWKEVDRLVNYRFIKGVMDKLPEECHLEFMNIFVENPNDEEKIFGYLEGKVGENVRDDFKNLLKDVSTELVHDLMPDKEITKETHSEGKVPVK